MDEVFSLVIVVGRKSMKLMLLSVLIVTLVMINMDLGE